MGYFQEEVLILIKFYKFFRVVWINVPLLGFPVMFGFILVIYLEIKQEVFTPSA